jgi:hypothetical protein
MGGDGFFEGRQRLGQAIQALSTSARPLRATTLVGMGGDGFFEGRQRLGQADSWP